MSLIVEIGTGSATAESYISVTDAGTYHTNRGNTAWAALLNDTVREQCLRKATEYMDAAYHSRWQGVKAFVLVQALDWPRSDVIVDGVGVDYNSIPEAIKRACAELALRASSAALLDDQTQGVVREQVGPIAVEYDRNSPQATRYKAIDAILAPFLKSGGGCSVGLVRT